MCCGATHGGMIFGESCDEVPCTLCQEAPQIWRSNRLGDHGAESLLQCALWRTQCLPACLRECRGMCGVHMYYIVCVVFACHCLWLLTKDIVQKAGYAMSMGVYEASIMGNKN